MIDFKEYKLGDICSRLSSGKGISSKEIKPTGEYPVYGGNGLRGYTDKSNFYGECAIIGRQGAFCGNVRFFSGEAYMTEHAVIVCANKSNSTRYLSYLLSTMGLGRLSGQSAQPGLSVKTLSQQSVMLPPLCQQNEIAATLAALDEKIENNSRINHHLEQMAQAIFSEMCSNGKSAILSDILNVCYGKDHKRLGEGKIPCYGSGGIMRYVDKALYIGESVLIPRKGSLNNVMYVNEAFWTVDTMFYTHMTRSNVAKLAYFIVRNLNLAEMNVGSAVPSMTTAVLNSLEIILPSDDKLEKFENIVSPMFVQMRANNEESARLAELRDNLLPRLMSGELSVADLDDGK